MIVYVNGDSHSAGAGLALAESYGAIVANHLNGILINQAVVGSSNQQILRTTQKFIETNRPDLVIIGWSTWEREEWEHEGQYYQVNSSGHDQLPPALVDRYKQWVIDQTPEVVDQKARDTHQQIYQLHKQLQEKQIPHVFFNCMYNVFGIDKDNELDWNNSYIHPYNNDYSYYWYLRNHGYVTDEWYHYRKDGHQTWAKFLIEYIDHYVIIR